MRVGNSETRDDGNAGIADASRRFRVFGARQALIQNILERPIHIQPD
jgi:hypothetical protein